MHWCISRQRVPNGGDHFKCTAHICNILTSVANCYRIVIEGRLPPKCSTAIAFHQVSKSFYRYMCSSVPNTVALNRLETNCKIYSKYISTLYILHLFSKSQNPFLENRSFLLSIDF